MPRARTWKELCEDRAACDMPYQVVTLTREEFDKIRALVEATKSYCDSMCGKRLRGEVCDDKPCQALKALGVFDDNPK